MNNNKKCILVSCFNNYENRVKWIADYFRTQDMDVTYIASDFNHASKERFKIDYPGALQIHVPAYKKNISPQRLWSHIVFARKTYKYIKKEKPDILYCMYPPNSLVKCCAKYKEKSGCKLIFDAYDSWPESFPLPENPTALKYLLKPGLSVWRNLRAKYVDKADLLLTEAKTWEKRYKARYPKLEVRAVYPVIDLGEPPQYTFNTEKLSFCYLGNINSIADTDGIVCLLSAVRKHKPVVLHIIGQGEKLNSFVFELRSNDIEVICHGTVFDPDEKKIIYSGCCLGINMPKTDMDIMLSLKSIEYMSVGLPFVNTVGNDTKDLLDAYDAGYNTSQFDLSQCAEQISGLDYSAFKQKNENMISLYNNVFKSQNYDNIIGDVIL